MSLVRRRPGGTVAALVARGLAGLLHWWTFCGLSIGAAGQVGNVAALRTRRMAGGAGVTSVGLRRRSPPLIPMTEGASLTRSGATVGEPRPSARNPAPFPSGEGVTAKAVTDRESLAGSASRLALCEA